MAATPVVGGTDSRCPGEESQLMLSASRQRLQPGRSWYLRRGERGASGSRRGRLAGLEVPLRLSVVDSRIYGFPAHWSHSKRDRPRKGDAAADSWNG